MTRTVTTMTILATALLSQGCASHRVKYEPFVKSRIPATERAVSVPGSFDEAKALFEKAKLPHNSPRQKYELALEGMDKLTDQLGSDDYVLIGEVFGGGNARANQGTLAKALCRKAARKGGDVVMIVKRTTVEQAYSYTTPGFSTTNASARIYGNYAYGTSNTTHILGRTYSGIMYKPRANGLVFKHVPGVDAERRHLLLADDESLSTALGAVERLTNNKKLSWEEAMRQWRQIVKNAVEGESDETVQ